MPGMTDGYTRTEVWTALNADPTIAAETTESGGPWVSRSIPDKLVITGRSFINRCATALAAAGIAFTEHGYARPYLEIKRDVARDKWADASITPE